MLLNRANLADLFIGYNTQFKEGFGAYKSDWNRIGMRVPSSTKEEHYAWLGQFPGLREWLGERQIKQLKAFDYRIKNKPFESTVEVDSDDVMYDRYGIYSPLMMEMGRAAAAHPDELLFGLLKTAFTTPCYDGQYYFDTDHPVGRDGAVANVSNHGGGGGTPWFLFDTSRAIKPLIYQEARPAQFVSINKPDDEAVFMTRMFKYGVDSRCNAGFGLWQLGYASKQTLDAAGLNAGITAMQAFKSDEGRPLGINPTLLVVPPTLRQQALDTVKAERNAAGATNTNQNAVDVLITPWLS
jgi:phage major head subunit gpT-like protein